MRKRLVFVLRCLGKYGGIFKTAMDGLCFSRKHGAALAGIVAYRHHVIKINAHHLAHVLGFLIGNVCAGLFHYAYRPGVEIFGIGAGRIRLYRIPLQLPCPPLGHLAAARVAGAEKEYFQLFHFTSAFIRFNVRYKSDIILPPGRESRRFSSESPPLWSVRSNSYTVGRLQ